jgi:hypothetical protein
MLAAIFKTLGGGLIDKLIDPFTDLFKAYLNKEISKEELRTKLLQSFLSSVTEIEKAHADSITKTYATFMQAAVQSRLMLAVWAAAALSQLLVLLWHQVGISALCFFMGDKACWPSSGTTVDWAYAVLMFCLGGGAIALRTGPAKFDMDKLKAMIAR